MTREHQIKLAVRKSHEMQFNGMDYQRAAWEVGHEIEPLLTDEEIQRVESAPEPGCDCGFCQSAPWEPPCDSLDCVDRTPYVL